MAIFPNSQGLWEDTTKAKNPEELSSFYASLVGPNSKAGFTTADGAVKTLDNNALATLLVSSQHERERIDKQAAIFQPLAATASGEDALNDLLADKTQPMELRAAAAQATYPGVKASIGSKGEIAFSAAPGSDLGFNYPNSARKTTNQNNAGSEAKTTVALENFDSQVQALQSTADYAEVSTIYQSLMASSTEFQTQRKASYDSKVGTGLGMENLEQQLQTDKVLDQQFYDANYAGQNQGPTEESLANIKTYQALRAERDTQVNELMKSDPEMMMLTARMQAATNLINQRLGETAIPDTGLVPPQDVSAAIATMYGSADKGTPADRLRIVKELETMNPSAPASQALEISRMDNQSLAQVATISQGQPATWASNALKSKLPKPEVLDQLKAEVAAFDTKYAQNLSEEQLKELQLPPTAITPKDIAIAKEDIKAKKFGIVMQSIQNNRRANFEQTVDQWELPQDPLIRDEVAATIQTLKAAKKDPAEKVTLDEVISNLSWTGGLLDDKPGLPLSGGAWATGVQSGDTAKAEAVTAYILSQSANLDDGALFGPPGIYGNSDMTRGFVNGIIVKNRMRKSGRAGSPFPLG